LSTFRTLVEQTRTEAALVCDDSSEVRQQGISARRRAALAKQRELAAQVRARIAAHSGPEADHHRSLVAWMEPELVALRAPAMHMEPAADPVNLVSEAGHGSWRWFLPLARRVRLGVPRQASNLG
jgi:hypothetical protein